MRFRSKVRQRGFLQYSPLRTAAFWMAAVVYMELVYKTFVYCAFSFESAVYTLLFSVLAASVLFTATSVFPQRANRITAIVLSACLFAFYAAHLIYMKVFTQPLSFDILGVAGQALDFASIASGYILRNWYALILLAAPLVFICVSGNRVVAFQRSEPLVRIVSGGSILVLYGVCLLALLFSGKSEDSAYTVYFNRNSIQTAQFKLGLLTSGLLDTQRTIFGFTDSYQLDAEDPTLIDPDQAVPAGPADPSGTDDPVTSETTGPEEPEKPVEYEYNVMDIDFDKLIKNAPNNTIRDMHKYFSKVQPTKKNKYTGMFEGDNLVYITAEAFWNYAVSEKYTPTLYKLMQEGIQFNNFYNPIWAGSTSTGEFAACTGVIPSAGRSMERSAKNYLPFALGNQFLKLADKGYGQTYAYHNNTYSMYGRDKSHPNMGYTYKGIGNGLVIENPKTWAQSDQEMIAASVGDYINQERFHAYYMTVSGHTPYSFGNRQASLNKEAVADLKDVLPDACRAYIACQITFDKAMETLLNALEKAGKLDNTVIVISADHYPYGLSEENLNALAGKELDLFERQRSTLIIWKNNLEPIVVDKPTSSVDIIPTISNLFGLEYDSRLLSGRDALSDEKDELVVFLDSKWLTDICSYMPGKGVTGLFTDKKPEDAYLKSMRAAVNNRTKYAKLILQENYYAYVFGKK